jgi:hypothetical protein
MYAQVVFLGDSQVVKLARELLKFSKGQRWGTYSLIITKSLHKLGHEEGDPFWWIRFHHTKHICNNTGVALIRWC